jgi:hypothetical protein
LLHRRVLCDFSTFLEAYRSERDALEKDFTSQAFDCAGHGASERRDFSDRCFTEADRAEKVWLNGIAGTGVKRTNNLPYRIAWNGFNRAARMPDTCTHSA